MKNVEEIDVSNVAREKKRGGICSRPSNYRLNRNYFFVVAGFFLPLP
jgi:hypothetical protein